jgi:flavin-dependent dehydrogenase
MYDVIVTGARCAGSSTALLLARSGVRVLVLERGTFPKDTLNGHGVLAAGARSLQQWGLLDRVLATGCQPFSKHRYEFGPFRFAGDIRWPDGSEGIELAPRRFVLDTLLAEAAEVAGAEVRFDFAVDHLIWEKDRVVGIRGRGGVEERAHLVIGADGFRSNIAANVGARTYEDHPAATCLYYSHWSDLPTDSIEVYVRAGMYAIVFPTNDGLTCAGIGWPHAAFARVRADLEGEFARAMDRFPELAERLRAGRREEPLRGTADLPMFLRTPFGPGWALVGDAGCRVDPITGQGITDAFRDAEFLSEAVIAGFSGAQPMLEALAGYHRRRDAAVLPIYRFTAQRAQLESPTPEQQALFAALVTNQPEADRFAGVTAGTTSPAEFFAPDNIARILGHPSSRAA